VLLMRRANTGYMDGRWSAVAGHVDSGESFEEAIVREAREEAGVRLSSDELTTLTVMHRLEMGGPAVEQRIDTFFEVRRWDGDPHITEPHKCSDMRWFPLDRLPDDVVPHERQVLTALAADEPLPRLMTIRS
jgi:8-oxo-dGTP pyrophosphatase MutT (NUDIX family)